MKNLFWTGYSNSNRIQAIIETQKIVNNFGYIIDFKQYSDISITLQIEIEENKIEQLHLSLLNYLSLDDCEIPLNKSFSERIIFLNITFSKSTGDLRIKVPAVPG